MTLSPNTQAILLLTAPLVAGGGDDKVSPLKPSEYKNLARMLRQLGREPADFLGTGSDELVNEIASVAAPDRLHALLKRGFAFAQALDRWEQRSIWVVTRADAGYPPVLKKRLGEDAPPVLYGVGDPALLGAGGLAVVGSRRVDDDLLRFSEVAGRLAAQARKPLVSGGARGVDQASMRGAADEGGMVVGVLADSLERGAVRREHRQPLMDGRMVLVSPYDPAAGFHVGHAMQRNKLIYALSDAALIVNADLNKGGTWSGAVEQLEKLHFVPVFVRRDGPPSKALDALRLKGALPWPDPETGEELRDLLATAPPPAPKQLALSVNEPAASPNEAVDVVTPSNGSRSRDASPAEQLMRTVWDIVSTIKPPFTVKEVAGELDVTETQAREWLNRMVKEGQLEKLSKPARYQPRVEAPHLFER